MECEDNSYKVLLIITYFCVAGILLCDKITRIFNQKKQRAYILKS